MAVTPGTAAGRELMRSFDQPDEPFTNEVVRLGVLAVEAEAALAVARRFDADAFACDFGGATAVNLPNLGLVIPLEASHGD